MVVKCLFSTALQTCLPSTAQCQVSLTQEPFKTNFSLTRNLLSCISPLGFFSNNTGMFFLAYFETVMNSMYETVAVLVRKGL